MSHSTSATVYVLLLTKTTAWNALCFVNFARNGSVIVVETMLERVKCVAVTFAGTWEQGVWVSIAKGVIRLSVISVPRLVSVLMLRHTVQSAETKGTFRIDLAQFSCRQPPIWYLPSI